MHGPSRRSDIQHEYLREVSYGGYNSGGGSDRGG